MLRSDIFLSFLSWSAMPPSSEVSLFCLSLLLHHWVNAMGGSWLNVVDFSNHYYSKPALLLYQHKILWCLYIFAFGSQTHNLRAFKLVSMSRVGSSGRKSCDKQGAQSLHIICRFIYHYIIMLDVEHLVFVLFENNSKKCILALLRQVINVHCTINIFIPNEYYFNFCERE